MPTIGVFAAITDASGRLLCVRQNYGHRYWTTPGRRVEVGESLLDTLRREVFEETGLTVVPGDLIGIYHKLYCADLVFSIEAHIAKGTPQVVTDEIAEVGYFGAREVPAPMAFNTQLRVLDALERRRGVVRVFRSETSVARPPVR